MPYVVSSIVVWNNVNAGSSGTAEIPRDYEDGDLIIVTAQQDGGGGTLSISNTSAATWTDAFSTGQAGQNAQRIYAWYAYASGDMGDVTVSMSNSEQLTFIVTIIRGAHQSSPIDVSSIGGATGALEMVPPSVSTNFDNSLLIYGAGADGSAATPFVRPGKMIEIGLADTGATSLALGFLYLDAAGVRPSTGAGRVGGSSGQAFVIAVRDDGTNRRRGAVKEIGSVLRWFGVLGQSYDPTDTWEGPGFATAILGSNVSSTLLSTPTESNLGTNIATNNTDTTSIPEGVWEGAVQVLASPIDLTNSLLAFTWRTTVNRTYTRALGLALIDGSGNWAFYRYSVTGLLSSGSDDFVVIDVENFTPSASSGTVDWSNIAKIGWMRLKIGSPASAFSYTVRRLIRIRQGDIVVVSGRGQEHVGLALDFESGFDAGADSNTHAHASLAQGAAQWLTKVPVQFGDASGSCDMDMTGAQIESPPAYSGSRYRQFFMVNDNREVGFSVKAVAGDKVLFRNALISSRHRMPFVIDTGTSPSAELTFSGATFIGMAPVNNVSGVAFDGAVFSGCHTITLNGGSMTECTLTNQRDADAVITNNPGNITNCTFVSSGTGHAIEITQPGTYSFVGNTFEGYGVDGSTDAAIYNNSGGAVTLNISGGGDTPTVRNAAGSTTTINNNVTITLDGVVVGSSIRVEKVSDGSLVEFRVAGATTEAFSVSGGFNYRVKVRKASSAPKYVPFETQTGTITSDTTVFVQQGLDPIA